MGSSPMGPMTFGKGHLSLGRGSSSMRGGGVEWEVTKVGVGGISLELCGPVQWPLVTAGI